MDGQILNEELQQVEPEQTEQVAEPIAPEAEPEEVLWTDAIKTHKRIILGGSWASLMRF